MHTPTHWQRLVGSVLPTDRRRRTIGSMALLALVLMAGSAGVMLMLADAGMTAHKEAVQWWAAISVGGLVVMTVMIFSGWSERLPDPSLTIVQMSWTITSGAVAYVLAGDARGVVPSVLAMILFFGTFGLSLAQVIGIGSYALFAFVVAVAAAARFNAASYTVVDTAYALMVLLVLAGSIALNLRIQSIRQRLGLQREALAQALAENRELAMRDELTGLLNRRAMLDLMLLEQRRSLRSGRPLLLALLDIDHFKPINDQHGHSTGDRALQAFTAAVRGSVRDTDVLARWGGEEFVLMLCDTRVDDGLELLDRVRGAVAQLQVLHVSETVRFTVSAGLAQHMPGETIEHTLDRADQALYTAKALGRNRVAVAPSPRPMGAATAHLRP
ncbi:diguanylate cyclase (GGDEF)-like protein [Acidovorax soli]|uniref:diguanylate cyclase n=1 Tax=Acidovorax soli TaxID=592050 RepID=A0A7X0P9W4_9BURK|nr:diguanylate cyclase [Acidovorax soli]MBB6557904.1 diguanylate cyclase (GGDEF)-like protein [Acidovorax soli]